MWLLDGVGECVLMTHRHCACSVPGTGLSRPLEPSLSPTPGQGPWTCCFLSPTSPDSDIICSLTLSLSVQILPRGGDPGDPKIAVSIHLYLPSPEIFLFMMFINSSHETLAYCKSLSLLSLHLSLSFKKNFQPITSAGPRTTPSSCLQKVLTNNR